LYCCPLLLLLLQSTYVEHLHQHCQAIKRSIHCINLGGQTLLLDSASRSSDSSSSSCSSSNFAYGVLVGAPAVSTAAAAPAGAVTRNAAPSMVNFNAQ
jgi:hypothetical protein